MVLDSFLSVEVVLISRVGLGYLSFMPSIRYFTAISSLPSCGVCCRFPRCVPLVPSQPVFCLLCSGLC